MHLFFLSIKKYITRRIIKDFLNMSDNTTIRKQSLLIKFMSEIQLRQLNEVINMIQCFPNTLQAYLNYSFLKMLIKKKVLQDLLNLKWIQKEEVKCQRFHICLEKKNVTSLVRYVHVIVYIRNGVSLKLCHFGHALPF